jgi:hypothetical protein
LTRNSERPSITALFCLEIRFYLMSLPGSFLGPLTFYFLTGGLVFMPWAFIKKITAINTKKLFHIVAPNDPIPTPASTTSPTFVLLVLKMVIHTMMASRLFSTERSIFCLTYKNNLISITAFHAVKIEGGQKI